MVPTVVAMLLCFCPCQAPTFKTNELEPLVISLKQGQRYQVTVYMFGNVQMTYDFVSSSTVTYTAWVNYWTPYPVIVPWKKASIPNV